MDFKKIDIETMNFNPFTLINKEWMLITAGSAEGGHNTMTASWGGLGELWGKYAATIYIRPQRYTLGFVDESEYFSLCFFDEEYRNALNFCGTKSGRDYDKDAECGLTVCFDNKAPYYKEAKLVFICRKMYRDVMREEGFIDESIIGKAYPGGDFHNVFVGEICEVLSSEA